MSQNKKQTPKSPSRLALRRQKARQQRQSIFWLATAILTILALSVTIVWWARRPLSSAESSQGATVSVQEAYQQYQQGTLLIDVRSQEEWDQGHIPNTVLIPLEELPNRLNELPRDKPIVVVCRSGNRSQQGRDILLEAGFEATSMDGGVRAWYDAGYPLDGNRP